ncbi:18648_t:CDS:2, partial [Acaulospora morrowiae]
HWLSKEFELNEILLCLIPMPYPHISQAIREFLIQKVQDFNLQDKILCVITDNGSNMVAVIRDWDGIERLPCTAHTLQLSVNHTLKKNHQQIHRIRELVKLFDSSKQSQRLDAAQIEISKQKRRNDIPSHDPILSDDSDYDGDSEDVENEVSTNYPIDKFISILKNVNDVPTHGFQQHYHFEMIQMHEKMDENCNNCASEYFSAGRYPTIAFIHPLMEPMKFHYAQSANFDENGYENEEVYNFDSESEDSSENDLVVATESQPNTQSLNNQENQLESDSKSIIKEIQTIIYNSLFEYWNCPSKICLLATLLDPLLKEMSFASDKICNDTIHECQKQLYQLIQPPTVEHTTSSNSTTLSFNNMFANVIFGTQRSSSLDELDYYPDFR